MTSCRGKLRYLAVFAFAALLALPSAASADTCPTKPNLPSADGSQPSNLGILKLQLLDYKCFGAYDRDVANVLGDAQAYLGQRSSAAASGETLAVVLDIDETSVSNWANLAADDFGFFLKGACTLQPQEPCGFDQWIATQTPEVIKPALDLFNAAKKAGVMVFFISARREDQRDVTIKHLTAAGYKDWDGLVLKQPSDPAAVSVYKSMARANIEQTKIEKKIKIIANIGDQYSDLAGGHAERTFKVPNPFYFIP
jgi:acid phosphatase